MQVICLEDEAFYVLIETVVERIRRRTQEIPVLKSSFVFNRCQLSSYTPSKTVDTPELINLVERVEEVDAYIASWLKALKENKQCIFTAASEALKAIDFLQELQPN